MRAACAAVSIVSGWPAMEKMSEYSGDSDRGRGQPSPRLNLEVPQVLLHWKF